MKRHPSLKAIAIFLTLTIPPLVGSAPAQTPGQASGASQPVVTFKENEEIPADLRLAIFTLVWEKVRDEYFDPTFGGKDWNGLKDKYAPLAAETKTSGPFHALLGKMLGELGRSHLAVIAPHQLPGGTKTNHEVRMTIDGIVLCAGEGRILVASVSADSPPWKAGLRPGYALLKAGETAMPAPEEIRKSTMRALIAARQALSGPASSEYQMIFLLEWSEMIRSPWAVRQAELMNITSPGP